MAAAFILLLFLISAGYFINLDKSSPQPSTFVRFLGFISDSILQAFLVPLDKKENSKRCVRNSWILLQHTLKASWEKLCRLALRFWHVSFLCLRCLRLSLLSLEILNFMFQFRDLCDRSFKNGLFSTTGPATCVGIQSTIFLLPGSPTPRRAVLVKDGASQEIRDFWMDSESDINVLEARALSNALSSFFPSIRNMRINMWTDNVTLQAAWENGGCKNPLVNHELKKGRRNVSL